MSGKLGRMTTTAPLGARSASMQEMQEAASQFECNICLEIAKDPVVTMCGHLYCWRCLHLWVSRNSSCPVCKDFVDSDRLIPIYCRGLSLPRNGPSQHQEPGASGNGDEDIPPRPAGLRLLLPHEERQRTPAGTDLANLGFLSPQMFPLLQRERSRVIHQQPEFLARLLLFTGSLVIMFLLLF